MDASSDLTAAVVRVFNAALNNHHIDAVMELMTDDCIFENTFPAPDGTRHIGALDVRSALTDFLANSPKAHFSEEELIACGDRCVVRWKYSWGNGHVRGVDVIRLRDGKISEKFSYVKG
jgi:ketosteroid isomerase-like protein